MAILGFVLGVIAFTIGLAGYEAWPFPGGPPSWVWLIALGMGVFLLIMGGVASAIHRREVEDLRQGRF